MYSCNLNLYCHRSPRSVSTSSRRMVLTLKNHVYHHSLPVWALREGTHATLLICYKPCSARNDALQRGNWAPQPDTARSKTAAIVPCTGPWPQRKLLHIQSKTVDRLL